MYKTRTELAKLESWNYMS